MQAKYQLKQAKLKSVKFSLSQAKDQLSKLILK